MKILPKYICAHPDGYLVRIYRGKVLFHAFVPKSHPAPIDRAIELRDRFIVQAAALKVPKVRPHRKGNSNTGIVGISETIRWNKWRSYPCFSVTWNYEKKQRMKHFTFGRGRARATALQSAINHRRKMTEAAHG